MRIHLLETAQRTERAFRHAAYVVAVEAQPLEARQVRERVVVDARQLVVREVPARSMAVRVAFTVHRSLVSLVH